MRRIGIEGLSTILAAALAALLCQPGPAKAELRVTVSKSQQRLAVLLDGTELYRWPVSTGRRGYTTPSGTFHPVRLERHWYSRKYDWSPMPWSVFFHRGYAMHGTMEVNHLGHAASHGCVRMRPDNASILYSLVRAQGIANTRIVVMDGPLPAAPGAAPNAVPMSQNAPAQPDATEHFAKALPQESVEVSEPAPPRDHATNAPRVEPHSAVARGDDAAVLRQRQAWLTGLAHKYGYKEW
jgi:hypothetical protein